MSGNKFEPQLSGDDLGGDLPLLSERAGSAAVADYLQVFGLERDPFEDAPDETGFFPSSTHQHASQQLMHLQRYGSGVLLLHGDEGSGRSLLVRALLAQLDADTVACSLELPAAATAEQLLAELARGLALDGSVDYKRRDWVDAICDVCEEMAGEEQSLLVVLDDADRQSDDAVGALLDVIGRQPDRAHALLVVRSQAVDRFKRLLAQREVPAQAIALGGLSSDEVYDYLRFRFQRAGNEGFPFTSPQVEAIIEQSGGLPAAVNAQARRLLASSGGRGGAGGRLGLPFGLNQYHLGGVAVALALVILGVVYAPSGGREDVADTAEPAVVERPVASSESAPESAPAAEVEMKSIDLPLPGEAPAPTAAGGESRQEVAVAAPAEQGVQSGAIQRLPAPAEPGAEVAAAPAAQPVAEVVPAIAPAVVPAEPQAPAVPAAVEAAAAGQAPVRAVESAAPASAPAPVAAVAAQKPVAEAPVKKVAAVAKPKAAATAKVLAGLAADEKSLMAASPRAFAIQLAGASSESRLRKAVAAKAGGVKVRYYRTVLNGKPFYVAVTGEYPSAAAARAAIARLPSGLRAENPWAVPLSTVQAKIRQGR